MGSKVPSIRPLQETRCSPLQKGGEALQWAWRHGAVEKCLQWKAGLENRVHSKLVGEVAFWPF